MNARSVSLKASSSRLWAGMVVVAALLLACQPRGRVMAMEQVKVYHVYEAELTAAKDYDNPFWDVTVTATFTSPSGKTHKIEAFWDGGRTWRLRFAPDEVGQWKWQTVSEPEDGGLSGKSGALECVAYEGDNPVFKHGPLRISPDRRYIQWGDGTPFFWLADTAWNGVLCAKEDDWRWYLQRRREQGFTAIQFVCTHWRGLHRDPVGETAWEGEQRVRLNPAFFQRMDRKVAMINEAGLVAVPVMLWACFPDDPGRKLPEADAIRVARYIMARWGAHNVAWFLGGDGPYYGEHAERWKRIGRAVFADRHDRIVTMHPGGRTWPYDDLGAEDWVDFWGYQSSHGRGEPTQKWLTQGPPAQAWKRPDHKPIINLEPNYEAHPNGTGHPFTDWDVRQACYWSLLIAPTAGVTYGHNWIWPWRETRSPVDGHEYIGEVGPWREAVDAPAAQQLRHMRAFFDGIEWWRLNPAGELLAAQPGAEDVDRFIAAGASDDRSLIVAFTPYPQPIQFKTDVLPAGARARWFNPRTGQWTDAQAEGGATFRPPADGDWLLLIQK